MLTGAILVFVMCLMLGDRFGLAIWCYLPLFSLLFGCLRYVCAFDFKWLALYVVTELAIICGCDYLI